MSTAFPPQIDFNIARCRVVLSLSAWVAVFFDPTEPMITSWLPMQTGTFTIDIHVAAVLLAHLAYSLIVTVIEWHKAAPPRLSVLTTCLDVVFGALITLFTEGISSPMYAFFVFAVLTAGLTGGMQRAWKVVAISVPLYLSLIAFSAAGQVNFYIMRPIYLAVTGYLVGYLGQQRLNLESGIRELAAAQQRQRIARDLHDGQAQAFAAIVLSLESCQELLRRGAYAQALSRLSELQATVNREYDEVRDYARSLVGLEVSPSRHLTKQDTAFSVEVEFQGSAQFVELVMKIVREGVANIRRHAQARLARIRVQPASTGVVITIDDNGLGFRDHTQKPWTILSMVADQGGTVTVARSASAGAHLAITLPGE
jgi:signal transduction histidine kinase